LHSRLKQLAIIDKYSALSTLKLFNTITFLQFNRDRQHLFYYILSACGLFKIASLIFYPNLPASKNQSNNHFFKTLDERVPLLQETAL